MLITNNIIVAFEVPRSMKTKQEGAMRSMALKLDMSKAYDHLEWNHLEAMMKRMRFCEKWRKLIMNCITCVFLNFIKRQARYKI